MNHKLKKIEQEYIQKNLEEKVFKPNLDIAVGNTVRVNYRTIEGDKERIQPFEGVIISMKKGKNNFNATFTVRRVNGGYGVERVFPLYSPKIESIVILKPTYVKRAKLYYLRERSGKAARLKERIKKQNKPAKKKGDE